MQNKRFLYLTAIFCFIACFIDITSTFILGTFYYPNYSHILQPISVIGASASPISGLISGIWIVVGILFIFFGIGFRNAFLSNEKYSKIVSWLIVIYAIGDQIGSGVFPGNHIRNQITNMGIVHDIVSGIGIGALLLIPFFIGKIITKNNYPVTFWFSRFFMIFGIFCIIIFSISKIINQNENIFSYTGLWQRMYLVNYYLLLMSVSIIMLKEISKKTIKRNI
jgi:hypothetical protein